MYFWIIAKFRWLLRNVTKSGLNWLFDLVIIKNKDKFFLMKSCICSLVHVTLLFVFILTPCNMWLIIYDWTCLPINSFLKKAPNWKKKRQALTSIFFLALSLITIFSGESFFISLLVSTYSDDLFNSASMLLLFFLSFKCILR